MKEQLHLKNHLKEVRTAANLSQTQLAEMVGVSRNTIMLCCSLQRCLTMHSAQQKQY